MKKLNELRWIFFVSRRFANVDRSGRTAAASRLASLGICLGVMTLIVVLSVMNGFQLSFVDAIMEISSYHIRVHSPPAGFEAACAENPDIRSITPFYEAQSLVVGNGQQQAAAVIRAVPPEVWDEDEGFKKEMFMIRGSFNIKQIDSIVIGSALARNLGVKVGSFVNLLALSGGSDVDLLSDDRVFKVTGVFHTGYADINSGYAFINMAAGQKYFGQHAVRHCGIKLYDSDADRLVLQRLKETYPSVSAESWRSYNRSFFGALRIEKNMLLLLVLLIFVVVCINIFNSMRRLVYERRPEISVLSALGGRGEQVQLIFIMRGLLTGVCGAVPGLLAGMLLCIHMEQIFIGISHAMYGIQYFITMLLSPGRSAYVQENPMFSLYARIPARMMPEEILLITISGVLSALAASWFASRGILKLSIAEVLRDD